MMQPKRDKQESQKTMKIISICLIVLIFILVFTNLDAFSGAFKALMRVLSSVLYGVLFAYLLNPLVNCVDKRLLPFMLRRGCKEKFSHRISRVAGMLFAFAMALFMIYALIYMIVPQLAYSIKQIALSMPDYYKSIEKWVLNILEDNPEIKDWADMALEKGYTFLEDFVKNDLLGSVQKIVVSVTASAYAVIREVVNMVIGLVVSIYILLSKDKFLAQTKKITVALFQPETADRIMENGRQIDKIFNGFIIGKLIDSLIIGILCYIGVSILRMPYAVLVATIVGVTNIIPYFGPILGTIPCALLILLVSPIKCFYFVIFVLILQQIDGNIIGPRILGENVGISGFWILVSITVGGGLFGFIGMLLGVPVFAVLYMLVGDGVNRALKKKGKSTETRDYYAIGSVGDLPVDPPGDPPDQGGSEAPSETDEAADQETVLPEHSSGRR